MSLAFQVLGNPGNDNALLVTIDTGQAVARLLFDCGEATLTGIPFGDIQAIDHLLFSHLHMDHVSGFDSFFRCNYGRTLRPNHIWGPPDTARIMQHRFQGFCWNLHEQMQASWCVHDIHPDTILSTRLELSEAFSVAHDAGTRAWNRLCCEGEGYEIRAITMDHHTPSLAYIVREKPRRNISMGKAAQLGLKPGPWMKHLKDPNASQSTVVADGRTYTIQELRAQLVTETPGDAVAYLTDFLLDESVIQRLAPLLAGCRTIVCESQYRHADAELAKRNRHMTTTYSAMLARSAAVQDLILIHLSDRYTRPQWQEMLQEAQSIFPNTHYPAHWPERLS